MTYITISDVDTYAVTNETWTNLDTELKQRAVDQANLYLSNQNLIDTDAVPERVVTAGCELALLAMDNRLYIADEESLQSKSVKVGTIQINKSYTDTSRTNTGELNFIAALLQQYKRPKTPMFRVRRGL